jgi:hypothetical protein
MGIGRGKTDLACLRIEPHVRSGYPAIRKPSSAVHYGLQAVGNHVAKPHRTEYRSVHEHEGAINVAFKTRFRECP